MEWNDENLELYQRHILLSDIGIDGQEKISNAKVLVIGLGAIGSSVLYYLVSAGVGTVGLLGDSPLSLADVSSQILYQRKDVGKSKLSLAKAHLKSINPQVTIKTHKDTLELHSLSKVIKSYDLVLDCTDNFAPKFLINLVCVKENKPLVCGGIVDLSIQIITIQPHVSACYSCIYGVPKDFLENVNSAECARSTKSNTPTCAQSAIIGSVAGILGSMEATEAIKYLTGIKEPLYNTLLTLDTRGMQFRAEKIERNTKCPICKKDKK